MAMFGQLVKWVGVGFEDDGAAVHDDVRGGLRGRN